MSRWYRAYEGTVTDAKLAEVAMSADTSRSVAIACWHAVLENAATLNDGGRLDLPARRVAAILCEPLAVIERVFSEFRSIGLLDGEGVAAWKRRQFESDTSTERSRKHREAKRNVAATLQNADASPPETETETEKKEDTKTIVLGEDTSPAGPSYTDAKHELWGEGPALLESLGVAKSQQRTVIGRWCKEAGDDHAGVLEAIRRARDARVQNPVAWISRAIPTKANHERSRNNRPATGHDAILAAGASLLARLGDGDGRPAGPAEAFDAGRGQAQVHRLSYRGH